MQVHNKTANAAQIYTCDPRCWVSKYADYLFNYAIVRINNQELAQDLVQETFLAALERADRFEGRSSESTWLTAILKNKIIDVYRKKSAGMLKNNNEPVQQFDQEVILIQVTATGTSNIFPGNSV